MLAYLRENFAWLVLALVFAWSAVSIFTRRIEEAKPGAIVLRVGHWQLESGVREAFEQLAEDYRREVNPNVYIIQDAIPEGGYDQWVTSQLLSGNAPDLLEIKWGQIWLMYQAKYIHTSTEIAGLPNPHNKGTDLENVPMRMTFQDSMRSSYTEELQDYVGVPLSQFCQRVFYNRDLLRRLTGRSTAPVDYHEFIEVCNQIRSQRDPQGNPYTPIASSKYHTMMWEGSMIANTTFSCLDKLDFNRDGTAGADETFAAFRAGLIDFQHPGIRARFHMARGVYDQFQTGFSGLTRDEAVFLFAQEKAVFMSTGTWDAGSLLDQAKGRFEVGVMPFPRPSPGDPEFPGITLGPYREDTGVGFRFGVTRTSKHPEIANDFLRFLTSRANNEKFNKLIGWIPAVRGAELPDLLKGFEPQRQGVTSGLNLSIGGDSSVRWMQQYSLYQINQTDYESLAKNFGEYYITHGLGDLRKISYPGWKNACVKDEWLIASIRARAMKDGEPGEWVRYREATASRAAMPRVSRSRQFQLIEQGPERTEAGPYEYTPQVLEVIRRKLATPVR